MPEIGEVARVVHYLKKHIVGQTISAVRVQEDDIVYGKAGTSAAAFQKAMTGRKVLDARQQGKYFWMVMDKPPHPVMHLGMTGWMRFSNDESSYYKPTKVEENEWPPRFWKFVLETAEEPKIEAAFVDARRLARIRLVDADGEELRNTTPLKENGPDPVVDRDILTEEWLSNKVRSKKVPVKALLLDQANISGVGNWVADEVLYHAKIHPEQYSNTFSDAQLKQLHTSLLHICKIAVDTLADSSKFPEEWLMKHRWDKGKKGKNVLPNGEQIVHLKVGGRTSAIVPSVQKKTGPVAGDVSGGANEDLSDADGHVEEAKPKRGAKRPAAANGSVADTDNSKRKRVSRKAKKADEPEDEEVQDDIKPKRGAKRNTKKEPTNAEAEHVDPKEKEAALAKAPKRSTTKKENGAAKKRATNIDTAGSSLKAKPSSTEDEMQAGRRRSSRKK